MPRVLVVGAAGTLGHKTCLALARLSGVTVRGMVRTLSPRSDEQKKILELLMEKGVELVVGDVMQVSQDAPGGKASGRRKSLKDWGKCILSA